MSYFIPFSVVLSYGISEKYLKFAIHKYRNSSKSWQNKKDEADSRKVLIDLDSIPPRTRQKYNIPTGIEYFEQQLEKQAQERESRKQKEKERKENQEYALLEYAYHNDWHKYYSYYLNLFENRHPEKQTELAKLYAKNIAYWVKMVEITGGKYNKIHGALKTAFKTHLKLRKELEFTSSFEEYNRFAVYIGNVRKAVLRNEGIEDSIVHKSANRPKKTETNEFHKMILLNLLSHPKRYSYPKIVDLMNFVCERENYKTISESWVKHQMSNANPEFRNLVMTTRAGSTHFRTTFERYAIREDTTLPGDVWMIDGTPIQFFCMSKNSKRIERLNLFAVIDVSSRKIIGFDISYSEDRFNIMRAIQMAVEREEHLPAEIISDNFSANKTEEIMTIKKLFEEMGCNWRHHRPGNPQDKVYIERFFGSFQSVECALYDDYLGKGIKARDLTNNPSQEFLHQVLKRDGYPSENQMKQRIAFLISLYNQNAKVGKKSPNEAYRLEKPNAKELDFGMSALIFWKVTKNTVRNSMIKIKVKNKTYTYDIADTKTILALNGKTVRVRYDENQMDSVAVFDYQTDRFICECEASVKLVLSSVNRTDEDDLNIFKHTAKNKKFVREVNQIKEEINDKGLEVAGKNEIVLPHLLDLDKNKINDNESKMLIQYFSNMNGLTPMYEQGNNKPLATITHSKAVRYEDAIKKTVQPNKDAEILPVIVKSSKEKE